MSGSAEVQRRARRDDGFSMIEIIVAIGVFAVVLVALLPQLIVGIKATGTARVVSQAKGVGQGQLERMRHLPFHIAPAAGDYVDVLDYYFPDLGAPATSAVCMVGGVYQMPVAGWTGYVHGAARCDYEPATGAFYRTVKVVPAGAGIREFTVVVDTQFLSGATPPTPVTPPTGYDTQQVGNDNPAAAQVGVTVTVFYERDGAAKPVSSYSQIAERFSSTQRVRSESDVRVVEVGSVTADRVPISFSAGLLHLAGSVSYASTVKSNLAATSGEMATGEQKTGAAFSQEVPPAHTATALTELAGSLSATGCELVCWGGTRIPGFSLTADDGQPTAGTQVAPAQVLLTDLGNGGLSFDNSVTDDYLASLALAPPLVRLDPSSSADSSSLSGCGVGTGGTMSYLAGSGYLRTSDPDASLEVESCAVARTEPIELFPTTFAPHGVVRIELVKANARCLVQGAGHTPTTAYDYKAVVQYWDGGGYTTAATVVPGLAADPLESIPLTTSIGGDRTLGDYISSWSALTSGHVVEEKGVGLARLKVPGLVKIASQPVRPAAASPTPGPSPSESPSASPSESPSESPTASPSASPAPAAAADESSVVSLTVGALGCLAEDQR